MLTIIEARVLGSLLEKERTVPDQYPLTLNTLVLACNQATSREPVMRLEEHEVEATLTGLKTQGLVRFVHNLGSPCGAPGSASQTPQIA